VHLEPASVEDGAQAIRFNVFCFNRQPGIIIDYKDGSSRSDGTWKPETEEAAEPAPQGGEGGRESDPDSAGGSGAGDPDSSGAGGQGAASAGGSGSSYIEYAAAAAAAAGIVSVPPEESGYVLNLNSKKFHYPDCKSVDDMSEKNKYYTSADREAIIEAGFVPCKICDP
jgi:DNA-entry nuclease